MWEALRLYERDAPRSSRPCTPPTPGGRWPVHPRRAGSTPAPSFFFRNEKKPTWPTLRVNGERAKRRRCRARPLLRLARAPHNVWRGTVGHDRTTHANASPIAPDLPLLGAARANFQNFLAWHGPSPGPLTRQRPARLPTQRLSTRIPPAQAARPEVARSERTQTLFSPPGELSRTTGPGPSMRPFRRVADPRALPGVRHHACRLSDPLRHAI